MKAIFSFTPKFDNDFRQIISGLSVQPDFRKFILEHLDEGLVVTIERRRDKSERSRLSTFFNGIVVPHYVKILFNNGENVNKVEARDRLKKMFLRDYRTNEAGEEEIYTRSQTELSTPELLFFVKQVLAHFLEDYNETVPDMDTYIGADIQDDNIIFKVK